MQSHWLWRTAVWGIIVVSVSTIAWAQPAPTPCGSDRSDCVILVSMSNGKVTAVPDYAKVPHDIKLYWKMKDASCDFLVVGLQSKPQIFKDAVSLFVAIGTRPVGDTADGPDRDIDNKYTLVCIASGKTYPADPKVIISSMKYHKKSSATPVTR